MSKQTTQQAIRALVVTGTIALVLTPIQARADGFVTPWVGSAFGSGFSNGRTAIGVDAGAMGGGIVGGELDFGYSPSFFGTKNDFGNNTIINLMGNLLLGVPIGGTHGSSVRPYAVGGIGLLRTQIDGGTIAKVSSSDNMFGWDAGAGVMANFSEHLGLRVDARYMRGTHEMNTGVSAIDLTGNRIHFWRTSIGVVLR